MRAHVLLTTPTEIFSSTSLLSLLTRAFLLLRQFFVLAVTAAVVCVSGCAGLNVDPVAPDNNSASGLDDRTANGIRYYEPAYFLLVYSDAAGSVKTDVLVLPDTTRKMVAKPHAFLSKNKQVLSFTDGMLTDSAQTVDSAVIPAALIQAAQTAAEAAAKAGLLNAPPSKTPQPPVLNAPRLYKIVVHGSSVILLGSAPRDTIQLPITKG
jgi:hypothetical protein